MFYVDGERYGRWAGTTPWTMVRFMIPQGTHRLTWSYEKDGGATGGQDCVWVDNIVLPPADIVLDVEEAVAGETALYPNPCHGDFTLALGRPSEVSVFNLTGQQVLSLHGASGTLPLHLDAAGVYFVRICDEAGVEVKKVIVE